MKERSSLLGIITSGSLTDGLTMRLDPERSVEEIRAGKFVVVEGTEYDFLSLITDVKLDASSQSILRDPPNRASLLSDVLSGEHTYATVSLKPMLMVDRLSLLDFKRDEHLRPVKSIPSHFSTVRDATPDDVSKVFGNEEKKSGSRYFFLGNPLDMENVEVCLDMDRLIERSNGIFGKTGTGKTFLTRLVLAGLIRNNKAVNLIFDMHSEYGWQTRSESGSAKDTFVKGLKNLFPEKVMICTLDPESANARKVSYDLEVRIPITEIEVEDIAPLQEELNLHSTAIETAYILYNRLKKNWLVTLLDLDPKDMKDKAEEWGANKESLAALYRKLGAIRNLPFVTGKKEVKTEGVHQKTVSIAELIELLCSWEKSGFGVWPGYQPFGLFAGSQSG